jgi:hypothetical protein
MRLHTGRTGADMATIDYRGWRISSDPECWTLGKPKTRLIKGKHEIYLAHATYYPTLQQALQALIEKELRDSDAASATEVLTLLRTMKAEIAEMVTA